MHQVRPGGAHGPDEFIKFEMHRFGIAVLRVLNQKDHKKRDDRRGSVDHELPRIGVMENWSNARPQDDEEQPGKERARSSHQVCGFVSKGMEDITH
jgi:hypothetical protein